MHDDNQPVEVISVVRQLRKDGTFARIGGMQYIASLRDKGLVHNAKYYATIIRSASRRRRLQAILRAAVVAVENPNQTPEQTIGHLDGQISALLSADATIGIETAYDVGRRVVQEVVVAKTEKRELGLKTGVRPVDEAMRGLMPGSLTVLAARTSVGKTSFGMQIADTAGLDGRHVFFVSLEMTAEELLRRNLANDTGIDNRLLANCHGDDSDDCLTNRDIENVAASAERYEGKGIHIWAPASAKVDEIRRKARIRQAQRPVDLIVVDYLQIMAPRDHLGRMGHRIQAG